MAIVLAGCQESTSDGDASATTTPAVTATSARAATATPTMPVAPQLRVVRRVARALDVPWGLAFLSDGSALIAERPSGRVVRVTADGTVTPVGTVPGVRPIGEGGLLGLAIAGTADTVTVYAYFTSVAGDNRIVRMPYADGRLGTPTPVLTGIPAGGRHDGGRMVIGPDGKLWVGTGETGETALAQKRSSLGGKILRINLDGSVPPDNPFPDSPVWSYGHRNVQGLAFDAEGRLWATEFGQNQWDELNLIVKGGNYGWPVVEGRGRRNGMIDPLVQWPTDEASPSGLAILDGVAYVAALRGARIWQVPLRGDAVGTPVSRFRGDFGRIRTIEVAPDGRLWVTTSNRDGRGSPGADDDQVLVVEAG